ncbi:MAG: type IX secretion system outer membrane channel protein PorV [Chloroherpetonaceae bacterium]|nr:type IX secretion system outer membrane channel protein PorV [Chloroherpetonaceae bacterium]
MQNLFGQAKNSVFSFALLLSMILASSSVFAQDDSEPITQPKTITTAVPFLLISPDSRANGMGEANVAIADNASAMFWNPAGLGFQRGIDGNITHSNWLPAFNADLFYDYFSAKAHFEDIGTFGLAVTYLNLGTSEFTDERGNSRGSFKSYEFAITASYGVELDPSLAVGLGIRFINSVLTPQNVNVGEEVGTGQGRQLAFDLGVLWKPEFGLYLDNQFRFGLALANIGDKMTYIDQRQADPLPTTLRLGIAMTLVQDDYNSMIFATDFTKLLINRKFILDANGEFTGDPPIVDNVFKAMFTSWGSSGGGFSSITIGTGFEYWYGKPKLFAIRGGFFYEDANYGGRQYFTFGAGLRYDAVGIDFSYLSSIGQQQPLEGTVRFSILVNLESL